MACCLENECKNHPITEALRTKLNIEVFCLCSGHGKTKFKIWFRTQSIQSVLLISHLSNRYGWVCECAPEGGELFLLESRNLGEQSYQESLDICNRVLSLKEYEQIPSSEGFAGGKTLETFLKDPKRDPECVPLVVAMFGIPGIKPFSSCSGHGETNPWFYFRSSRVDSLFHLFDTVYKVSSWRCSVDVSCTDLWKLTSLDRGEEAYRQVRRIAELLQTKTK